MSRNSCLQSIRRIQTQCEKWNQQVRYGEGNCSHVLVKCLSNAAQLLENLEDELKFENVYRILTGDIGLLIAKFLTIRELTTLYTCNKQMYASSNRKIGFQNSLISIPIETSILDLKQLIFVHPLIRHVKVSSSIVALVLLVAKQVQSLSVVSEHGKTDGLKDICKWLEFMPKIQSLKVSNGYRNTNFAVKNLEYLKQLDLYAFNIATPLTMSHQLESLTLHNCVIDETVKDFKFSRQLKSLKLLNCQISDDAFLHTAPELTHLELTYNHLTHISSLCSLTMLTCLSLGSNQIQDIAPISNLTALTELSLNSNNIADITPLSLLKNLEQLDLGSNNIVNIFPLTDLVKLTKVTLSFNSLTDITPLSNLKMINELQLIDNSIVDLQPLVQLTGITDLQLSRNTITDLGPLSELMEITTLALRGNSISNIEALSNLIRMTTLDLSQNSISYIRPISNLILLSELHLSENSIQNLEPLSNMTRLTELDLSHNEITDLEPLVNLCYIGDLDLSHNSIININPLSRLIGIYRLILCGNQITEIAAISSLMGLGRLELDDNLISDTSPLSNLPNIDCLTLRRCGLSQVNFTGLTNLTELDIGENHISDFTFLVECGKLRDLDVTDHECAEIAPFCFHLKNLYSLVLGFDDESRVEATRILEVISSMNGQ
jgi:internalin A